MPQPPSKKLSLLAHVSLTCRAMSTEKNKELFLQQVQQILDGVKEDREQVSA